MRAAYELRARKLVQRLKSCCGRCTWVALMVSEHAFSDVSLSPLRGGGEQTDVERPVVMDGAGAVTHCSVHAGPGPGASLQLHEPVLVLGPVSSCVYVCARLLPAHLSPGNI